MSLLSRFFFLVSFLFVTGFTFLVVPTPANAALVPCGRSADDPATTAMDESKPCTACHLVLGGKGIIDWGLKVMTFIAIAVIVAMGILYIVSVGDKGLMETAKDGIKASLIGFAVMLGAWLIINTTLRIFSATIPGLTITSAGFTFICDTASSAVTR